MNKYFGKLEILYSSTFSGYRKGVCRTVPNYALKFLVNGCGYFGAKRKGVQRVEAPVLWLQLPGVVYEWGPDADGWELRYIRITGQNAGALMRNGFLPLAQSSVIPLRSAESVGHFFDHAYQICHNPERDHAARSQILLERLLLDIQRQRMGDTVVEGVTRQLQELAATIASAPQQDVDFVSCAEQMQYSYSHFRRLFRESLGTSPQDYLIRCRIQYAADMLVDTNEQIKCIAAAAGYRDTVLFTRQFRKRMGMSPLQFRQQHKAV